MVTQTVSSSGVAPGDAQVAAKLFRGFSEPVRLAILVELAQGERRVTDLVRLVGGSQANVSGHLSCLKDCGLVADRPEGRQVFYRIATPEVVRVLQSAEALLAVTGHRIELCPNYQGARSKRR
jgi:DNA-binding transcriptional ArsR family regulator